MNIGIIGSGIVGQVLARAFSHEAHEVRVGTRNPTKTDLDGFREANPDVVINSFADVAAWGELLILATNGSVVTEALELAGKSNFDGKVVIDTTNPIASTPPVDGVLSFFTDYNRSLMKSFTSKSPMRSL